MSELERLKDRLGYDLDGVGDRRLEALLDHFGSADAVPLTDMDALREADGVGPMTAGRIWEVAEPQSESDDETTPRIRRSTGDGERTTWYINIGPHWRVYHVRDGEAGSCDTVKAELDWDEFDIEPATVGDLPEDVRRRVEPYVGPHTDDGTEVSA